MRYHIYTRTKATMHLDSTQQASTYEVALGLFTEREKQLQPGQEVELVDSRPPKGAANGTRKYAYRLTPEDKKARAQRRFQWWIDYHAPEAEAVLLKHAEEVTRVAKTAQTDPLYVFEWSNSCFTAAAKLFVVRAVQEIYAQQQDFSKVLAYLQRELDRQARNLVHNSDACRLMVATNKLTAFAEAVETFKAMVEAEQED